MIVANGDSLSYQSGNFDFNYVIDKLADDFPHIDFLLTDNSKRVEKENVLYTSDVINCEGGDLNEISYLSTFCDTIIGKASGPYTFTIVKKNLNDIGKTYIFLCNALHDGLFYYNNICNKIWINNYDNEYIYTTIKRHLDKKTQIFPSDFDVRTDAEKIYIKPTKNIKDRISIDFIHNGNVDWNYTSDTFLNQYEIWISPFRGYESTVHNMTLKFYTGNKRFLFEKVIL